MMSEVNAINNSVQADPNSMPIKSSRPVSYAADKNNSFKRILVKVGQRQQQVSFKSFGQNSKTLTTGMPSSIPGPDSPADAASPTDSAGNKTIQTIQSGESDQLSGMNQTAAPTEIDQGDQQDQNSLAADDATIMLLVQPLATSPVQSLQEAQGAVNSAVSADLSVNAANLSQPQLETQTADAMMPTVIPALQAETAEALQSMTIVVVEPQKASESGKQMAVAQVESGQITVTANQPATVQAGVELQGQQVNEKQINPDSIPVSTGLENQPQPAVNENQPQPEMTTASGLNPAAAEPASPVLPGETVQNTAPIQLPISLVQTATLHTATTPEAAAPEQVSASAATVQTDETLNGQTPDLTLIEPDLSITSSTAAAVQSETRAEPAAVNTLITNSAGQETTEGQAAVTLQQADAAAKEQMKEKITLTVNTTESASAPAEGDEAEPAEAHSNSISKTDLRFKLMEKTLLNKNQKSGKDQTSTDIKKIMASESQRLINPRTVSEQASLTETSGSTNSQADTLNNGTGFERLMFTASRTEHTPPAVSTHSNAQNVNAQEVIDQIVQKAELLKSETSNAEMRIQLKPGFLGKMVIKIAVEDGLVTAKFVTESQHVKQLLEANLVTLKQNLESQGLKVDRTEVNVQLDNGGSFHGNEGGRELMWNELRDGNGQNRSSYQQFEEYQQGLDSGLEPVLDTAQESSGHYMMDGRVDFMI